MNGAVVALSGGQDSTTCLYYALRKYDRVDAVSFDYGQRHRVELVAAAEIARQAGVEQTVLTVPAFSELGDAALTSATIDVAEDATDSAGAVNELAARRGLPSTFVPGRNVILLGLAAAYGVPRGLHSLVTGICARDRAGYPDCRVEFARSMEQTLRWALDDRTFALDAPLLTRSKAQTWALAEQVGAIDAVLELSHTCYEGDHATRHEWGFGCGECPACEVRAEGFAEFKRTYSWPRYSGVH